MRREFELNGEEAEFLDTLSSSWETIRNDNQKWVLIPDFPIPEGYNVRSAIAAVLIPTGYPVAQLDMVYFYPEIKRKDGMTIPCTDFNRTIDGKIFQRWSRHYARKGNGAWDPQGDSIITHCMAIQEWLLREFRR